MPDSTPPPLPNPFASPKSTGAIVSDVKCPKCGFNEYRKTSFTWWGGALGPKLLKHVKCIQCGAGFNSVTGKSNFVPIIIYQVVAFVIAIAIFALWMAIRSR